MENGNARELWEPDMNATSAFSAAVVLFSLAASPALALPVQPQAMTASASGLVSKVDFVQGHEVIAGVPAGRLRGSSSPRPCPSATSIST